MWRSVIKTSKAFVVISFDASVTFLAATTSKPLCSRVSVIMSRTASSSSTSRTFQEIGRSVGVIQHHLSSRTKFSMAEEFRGIHPVVNSYKEMQQSSQG